MKKYSKLDLLLHRLALGSNTMGRIAFDMDCLFSDAGTISKRPQAPVYITGLARSGTTVLLQALYASRAFATLTYRNMPFVTAPLENEGGYRATTAPVDEVRFGFPRKTVIGVSPDWLGTWEATYFVSLIVTALGLKFGFRIE